MVPMSMEEILERVNELKTESRDKDEVIREQQLQINELEGKIKELEAAKEQMAGQVEELQASAGRADEILDRLSSALED